MMLRGLANFPRWTIAAWMLFFIGFWPAGAGSALAASRGFVFGVDTFAYANELQSEYVLNPATDRMVMRSRSPRPDYALHCFSVARGARQFFNHARFEPGEPKATPPVYRHLIRLVLARKDTAVSQPERRIVIPGFTNLKQFSAELEGLLKQECGGAWRSFVQRGNWRMVFPFSRGHQERMADRLAAALEQGRPPIVHLVRFPDLSLNHAVLLFNAERSSAGWEFAAYDPNDPRKPTRLEFHATERRFWFPRNRYFAGGQVNAYEIYCDWFH